MLGVGATIVVGGEASGDGDDDNDDDNDPNKKKESNVMNKVE